MKTGGKEPSGLWSFLSDPSQEPETCHQQDIRLLKFCPMRGEFCTVLSNHNVSNTGGLGLVGWHRRTSGSVLRYVFQCRVESTSRRIPAGKEEDLSPPTITFLIDCFLLPDIEILQKRWRRQPPFKEWSLVLKVVPGKKEPKAFSRRNKRSRMRAKPLS